MYTAVRIVKMKAWRKATRISKPVSPMSTTNGAQTMDARGVRLHSAAVRTANVTSKRWPANMLAKSRTAREKGRTKKVETNSMSATSGSNATGTPGGNITFLK